MDRRLGYENHNGIGASSSPGTQQINRCHTNEGSLPARGGQAQSPFIVNDVRSLCTIKSLGTEQRQGLLATPIFHMCLGISRDRRLFQNPTTNASRQPLFPSHRNNSLLFVHGGTAVVLLTLWLLAWRIVEVSSASCSSARNYVH